MSNIFTIITCQSTSVCILTLVLFNNQHIHHLILLMTRHLNWLVDYGSEKRKWGVSRIYFSSRQSLSVKKKKVYFLCSFLKSIAAARR